MTKDPREVGPLSRGAISPEDSTPIHPITGRRSLPPSSSTHRPVGDRLAAGLPRREDDGLTTFHGWITDGVGSASSPVARTATAGDKGSPLHLATYLLVQGPGATTSRSVERRDGGKCHHIPISHQMYILDLHSMLNRVCLSGHSENFLFLI